MSAAAARPTQRGEAEQEVARQAEDERSPAPNTTHRARASSRRRCAASAGTRTRPRSAAAPTPMRRGAAAPRPLGADVQDVAREDRQHRGRAAEQHREQVERDRRQHEPVAADIGEARRRSRASGWRSVCAGGCGTGPIRNISAERQREQRGDDGIGQRRGGSRRASRRRWARRSTPTCHAIDADRDRGRQHLARDEIGRERRIGRAGERARDAERTRRPRTAPAASARRSRSARRASPRRARAARSSPRTIQRRSKRSATSPTTGVSRNSGTNCARPIMPSRNAASLIAHRLAGDVVDLPADDDALRAERDRAGHPRQQIGAEVRDTKGMGRHGKGALGAAKP